MSKLKQYQMSINGEWEDSESKKTFETLNPENNEAWAIVPEASACLLYTSPSPRDVEESRMPSSA